MCVGVTLAHVHEIGGEGHSEKVITNNVSATDLFAFFTRREDRKSTRLNSSHLVISYAVFCLKKKRPNCETSTSWRSGPTSHTSTPLTRPPPTSTTQLSTGPTASSFPLVRTCSSSSTTF